MGDEVFFNHPSGPLAGTVECCGAHGLTIKTGKIVHKMKWPHFLGHKKRNAQAYQIADSGEDGHIVTDPAGRRRYVGVPNEAHEDPLVAKAEKPGSSFSGRPGLAKKVVTEKTGKQNTHWVRTGQDAPKERAKAAPDDKPHPNAAKTGDSVKFKAGDFAGEGTVVGTPGRDGAHVRDSKGRDHQVRWDEVVTKPDYPARNEGEDDTGYMKRAVHTQATPKHLPEEHGKYFHTKGSSEVPMEHLHSIKPGRSSDNASKNMEAAYHGAMGKRAPITVAPHPEKPGHFKVLDGNGTHAAATKHGWKSLPVNVVHEADYNAKEVAKKVVNPADFKDLPKKSLQPANTQGGLYALAEAGLGELKDWLNRGKGVASKNGFKTMSTSPSDITAEEYAQPGGMLFIGKIKGMERAAEKVEGSYGGNWNQLTDIVRCTLAVDNLHDMANIMTSLKKSGMKIAQQPKNKFLTPTDMGYADINLVVTMPNGIQAEVQLNVKDMLRAKNDGHKFYETTRKLDEKNAGIAPNKWDEADLKAYEEASNEQKRIYGEAWQHHVETHYGAGSNMIKSMRRVVMVFGR